MTSQTSTGIGCEYEMLCEYHEFLSLFTGKYFTNYRVLLRVQGFEGNHQSVQTSLQLWSNSASWFGRHSHFQNRPTTWVIHSEVKMSWLVLSFSWLVVPMLLGQYGVLNKIQICAVAGQRLNWPQNSHSCYKTTLYLVIILSVVCSSNVFHLKLSFPLSVSHLLCYLEMSGETFALNFNTIL